jgi:ABC-type sugar transport system substrate-binding protein
VKNRRIIALCIALSLIATAFAACAGKPVEEKKPAGVGDGDAGRNTAALFMPNLDDASMRDLSDAMNRCTTAAGIELTVYDAGGDAADQVSRVKEVAAAGVDVILLCPVSGSDQDEGIVAAKNAGIPVVVLRENIAEAEDTAAFVGPDYTNGGEQTMARAMRDLPEGGGVAEVFGAEDHPATDAISSGYAAALTGEESKYPVAKEGSGDWSAEKTLELVGEWFASGAEFSAIVCNNDSMATGAIEAVAAAKKTGQINIYGLGTQRNIRDAIRAGTVKATVSVDVEAEAKTVAEIAQKLIAGEDVERNHKIPMILITAENVDQYPV